MSIKIVIADDHQLFIDGIKSILDSEIGISIIGEANDGLQLIKLMDRNEKPDVVLTDIRMPIMDGIVATRVISKEYPDIPVLALSMYNQESDVREMMEAGAKGYIVKNAGKKEMIDAINTLHQRKTYLSKEFGDHLKFSHTSSENHRPLTKRETEILMLIARGKTSKQVSEQLNISKLTVDTHRKNIHKKLGITSNAGLMKYALQHLL